MRESSGLTTCASRNVGLSSSSSIAAVTPPTAYFAALSRKPRRSIAPWTYASNSASSPWSKSGAVLPSISPPALPEQRRRAIDLRAKLLDRRRDDRDVSLRLVPCLLLDALADAGQRLDAVARVEARRVDEMLEPLALRQAGVVLEGPFGRVQQVVQLGGLFAIAGRLAFRECRAVGVGRLLQLRDRRAERREVERRRVLRLGAEFFHLIEVAAQGACRGGEFDRQNVGVRQPQDGRPDRARQRRVVGEVRVGKVRVPVERVVLGVVHAGVRRFACEV